MPAARRRHPVGGRGEPRVVVAPGEDLRVARDGQQQPGQHRRPRHDRVDLEVLRRRMVVATDRPEAVERRARPSRTSCWRRTRRRSRCRRSEPEPLGHGLGMLDEPAAAGELLHRRARPRGRRRRRSCRAPRSRPRPRGWRPRPAWRPSAVVERTSTSSSQRSATTLGRVPPRMPPTLTEYARPAAVQGVQVLDEAGRLEDRAAALLGLDAGVGRAAVDRQAGVEDALAGAARCPRWRGHIRGPGTHPCPRPGARMCALELGEPISSSGLAMNTSRSNGRPPMPVRMALSAYRPASRPDFMSVTPGP